MPRFTRLAAVAIATGSLVLTGCGSSGGDEDADSTTTVAEATTTTSPSAAFVAALDELCAASDEAATQAGNDFEAALAELGEATTAGDDATYASALDDAETAVEVIIATVEDFTADVAELEVPPELQADLDVYLETLGTQRELAEQLRAAIVADDGAAFNEAVSQIEQADAETRQIRVDAAEALGATECVPDDESTDGTDSTDSKGSETTVAG